MTGRGKHIFVGVVVAAVGAAVIAGLMLAGSPARERARRLDEQRVRDLRSISSSVDVFWTRHSRLPAALEELSDEADLSPAPTDPVTAEGYEYRPTGDQTYDLCAHFELASGEDRERPLAGSWSHGSGKWCFELQASERKGGVRPHRDTTAAR